MSEIHTFTSAEARSPGRKPDVGRNQYKDRNTEEPYHSLALASLYRILPEAALSPFQLDPWYGG